MSSGGDQVGHPGPRIATGDQRLTDQHHVGAGLGEFDHVMRTADARFGDPDDAVRDSGCQPGES